MVKVADGMQQTGLFDYELLNAEDPFEVDTQIAHLFKHDGLGLQDAYDVWDDTPLFYPAVYRPAHWLLTGEVPGNQVLTVPLCPGRVPSKARPIGVYQAPGWLDRQYRDDTR
ncbi:MAG TPA: hypothetical protein VKU39_16485 [Streptosporangiaceae bacterium]|nr:hypothetical protein [Streptosporangiaceae bacterium]